MICDKCKTEVPLNNDATVIESYAFNNPMIILSSQSRHFLPVYDSNGNLICEGSPSRAQYIEGQPRDTRGFDYHVEYEKAWRHGFLECNKQVSVISE